MVKRKRLLSIVAGAMLLMVVATACGDDSPTPPGNGSPVPEGLTGSIIDLGLVDRGADLLAGRGAVQRAQP